MACGPGAPAGEGATPRRRRWGWARARALGGNSEASTAGLLAQRQQGQEAESESSSSAAGRRRSCKVAPEPREGIAHDAALPPTPGSPSFRYYCEKTAFVDRIVADADDSDGSIGIKATTRQASNGDEVTETNVHESHESSQVHEHKEGAKWPRFRGLSMVASAWNNMFSRHHSSNKSLPSPAAEAEPQPPPAAAANAVRSPL
ncbi:unnamed protein product [Urochloa decumbens]|uniref:Uncharacterized protein n=1 Tax=Urochloa decumbens TaxID=240449 RepID=A0ABC8ZFM6_9POAL